MGSEKYDEMEFQQHTRTECLSLAAKTSKIQIPEVNVL
jgi:hypothetical protein